MPRVMPKPKFKKDEIVVCHENLSAAGPDGVATVLLPGTRLRGDDWWVQRYPHLFHRDGDPDGLEAAYRAAVTTEQFDHQAEEKAKERERQAKELEQVQKLADTLEAQERKRRKEQAQIDAETAAESREQRQARLKHDADQREKERLHLLAQMEVMRRLDSAA